MKMQAAAGAWSEKRSSNNTDAIGAGIAGSTVRELLLLVALGAAIPALHASLHWPLKLPGHHGLELMALMMFGRMVSNQRWAALTIATSAAAVSFLPMLGFDELGMRVSYLLAGLTVDLLFPLLRSHRPLLLALIAATAHATKPLWKTIASSAWGLSFGSLVNGIAWPLLTHLCFGFVGGMIGVLLGLATRRMRSHGDSPG